jgi:hypothetical protein
LFVSSLSAYGRSLKLLSRNNLKFHSSQSAWHGLSFSEQLFKTAFARRASAGQVSC